MWIDEEPRFFSNHRSMNSQEFNYTTYNFDFQFSNFNIIKFEHVLITFSKFF